MNIQSLFGLIAFLVMAWLMSEDRRSVNVRMVVSGMILQFVLALVMLKAPMLKDFFMMLNEAAAILQNSTNAGAAFVFGYLGGAAVPFVEKTGASDFILAFKALPMILVISALSSLFFYWKILPYIVKAFSWVLMKTMNVGGAVGLSVGANVFVGMVEAPLFIRPYLKDLTRGELFMVMTSGMAGIAGTVMVIYANILSKAVPDAMGHILIASVISAPASIVVSELMSPSRSKLTTEPIEMPKIANSAMDAVTKGALEGVNLLINIAAMLVVLVALVHLANEILSFLPSFGGAPLSLQRVLGYLMSPVTWLMGVPWHEAPTAGALMGEKTILNEFIAYMSLAQLPQTALSEKSRLIMTYGLCGFANLGSLGIMIGGIGEMAPERRNEVVSLGFKSIVSGTISTCMTGAMAGLLT